MDYYSILGVARTATKQEIKAAYRRLAGKHHPDKGGNVETFKKIQTAYDVLGDDAKRAEYDNPNPFANANQNPFGQNAGFEDVFSTFFGTGFAQGRARQPRNKDITIAAKITLLDVIKGKKVIATYRLQSGREESVNIEIPPGANTGDTVRYEGLGDDRDPRFPRGNLYVKIQVERHKDWVRDGLDLITKATVDVFDLLLGCKVNITTIDNKQLSVTVPKGTAPGARLSIQGYGIPQINTGKKGNIYIHIEAFVPRIDDENIIAKIQEVKNGIS